METKHTCEQSERAFGRHVDGCPRCLELKNGAPARRGWQADYYARQARELRQRINAMPHDCRESNCGVVCTWGEW